MKTKKTFIILFALASVLFACQPSIEKQKNEIENLEQKYQQLTDTNGIAELLNKYYVFVENNPTDTISPEYLFRAAVANLKMGKGSDALRDFEKLVNKYPTFEKIPDAYFYRAFTYENVLYEMDMAKIAYEEFIYRYPEHNLVTDAKLSIKYLGMTPEEIVAAFENVDKISENE